MSFASALGKFFDRRAGKVTATVMALSCVALQAIAMFGPPQAAEVWSQTGPAYLGWVTATSVTYLAGGKAVQFVGAKTAQMQVDEGTRAKL